jgi:hypothetical protein
MGMGLLSILDQSDETTMDRPSGVRSILPGRHDAVLLSMIESRRQLLDVALYNESHR